MSVHDLYSGKISSGHLQSSVQLLRGQPRKCRHVSLAVRLEELFEHLVRHAREFRRVKVRYVFLSGRAPKRDVRWRRAQNSALGTGWKIRKYWYDVQAGPGDATACDGLLGVISWFSGADVDSALSTAVGRVRMSHVLHCPYQRIKFWVPG